MNQLKIVGSITKENGLYTGIVTIEWTRKPYPRQFWRCAGFKTKYECQVALKEIMVKIEKGFAKTSVSFTAD